MMEDDSNGNNSISNDSTSNSNGSNRNDSNISKSNGNNNSVGAVPSCSGGIEDMLPKHRIPVLSQEPTAKKQTKTNTIY